MSEFIKKYKDWKANPADYGYDCIGEFITDLTENETVEFMEWVEKLSDEHSNCNIPLVSDTVLCDCCEKPAEHLLCENCMDKHNDRISTGR